LFEELFEVMEMSDSKENREDSSDSFADDLDAMLNDEASTSEQDEMIDDEEVIDRLLMDDVFEVDAEDEKEQSFSTDEPVDLNLDESTSNKMAEKQPESDLDEFDVDDLIDSVSTAQGKEDDEFDEFGDDEFDVDSLLNSVAEETNAKKDEAPDVEVAEAQPEGDVLEDEFDIDDLIASESPDKKAKATEVKEDASDDDFLMADFDISADDEDDELLESNDNEEREPDTIEDETELSVLDEVADEQQIEAATNATNDFLALKKELETYKKTASKTALDLTQANEDIVKVNEKISQVLAENIKLQDSIKELTSTTTEKGEAVVEEVDTIQKEQRKFKKLLRESESKVPVITYVVMAVAILALLVGGGLGAVGYGAQTNVDGLTELLATLEEELEIITAKDSTADIREIKFQLNELKIKDDGINQQLDEVTQKIQQPSPLKAVVDDLLEQNEHAQKAIEQLLAAVETLENRPVVVSKVKAKRVKKIIPKVEWVVNLVSFKQEWYAKRKAEEFNKKGIPAKVEKVKVNGEKWFRLRVKGFKSKYEAAAYAVKIKKTLNLSSVWVTKV